MAASSASKVLGRKGLDREFDLLTDLQLWRESRWHGEVDLQCGSVLERRDDRSRRQIVAQLDAADPQHAAERRVDAFVLQARFCFRELRACTFEIGLRTIVLRLGNRLLLDQLAIPFEQDLGQLATRDLVQAAGLFDFVVEDQQELPGFDFVAGIEVQGRDLTGRFRGQVDALGSP